MPQTREVAPSLGIKRLRKLTSQFSHPAEMIFQWLPGAAVGGGVSVMHVWLRKNYPGMLKQGVGHWQGVQIIYFAHPAFFLPLLHLRDSALVNSLI